ncbi:MAG: diacylglycerol kinase family protein [Acidimicrobiia bacterium]
MKRQLAAIASLVAAIAAVVASAVTLWNHWDDLALALACLAVVEYLAWYVLSRAGVTRVVAAVGGRGGRGRDRLPRRRARRADDRGRGGARARHRGAGPLRAQRRRPEPARRRAAVCPQRRPAACSSGPKSGGRKADPEFVAEAGRRGIQAVDLTRHDDLVQLAHSVIDDGADVVGVAGGDGSQALVAGVAAERDIPFVCIPAGTLFTSPSISASTATTSPGAARRVRPGFERRASTSPPSSDRVFVNNVSLGLYAHRAVRRLPRRQGGHRGAHAARAARQRLRPVRLPRARTVGRRRGAPRPRARVEQRVYNCRASGASYAPGSTKVCSA